MTDHVEYEDGGDISELIFRNDLIIYLYEQGSELISKRVKYVWMSNKYMMLDDMYIHVLGKMTEDESPCWVYLHLPDRTIFHLNEVCKNKMEFSKHQDVVKYVKEKKPDGLVIVGRRHR
uniref:Uncharacterized protein n=1 Tax=Pithovirus LCPAC403 TaxID=2506596 RepID=A0A481ZDK7_9VIRU|nr:MAG: hypothetical protein LCPAC403_03640 [Pithovirus LCPAC403]